MQTVPLTPVLGLNTAQPDAALRRNPTPGDAGGTWLREAINVNIDHTGGFQMRPGRRKVSSLALKNLWQSPLHGDVFATLGGQWVKCNPQDWSVQNLHDVGHGRCTHIVLPGRVLLSGPKGLFAYDGTSALPLCLPQPAPPILSAGSGSLHAGSYGAAASFLRGKMEGPPSSMAQIHVPDASALHINLPPAFDPSITGLRLYLTRQNGGELARAGDFASTQTSVTLALLPAAGAALQWQHMQGMPGGAHLGHWKGRLLTASGNVLRFSEALAPHIHDARHGFVLLPQRITFIAPVEGGIWVGQRTHVVFLAGNAPQELQLQKMAARAPVPFSAVQLDAAAAGEISGGTAAVSWIADNGFVLGNASGQLWEPQALKLHGIHGSSASSVCLAHPGPRLIASLA